MLRYKTTGGDFEDFFTAFNDSHSILSCASYPDKDDYSTFCPYLHLIICEHPNIF